MAGADDHRPQMRELPLAIGGDFFIQHRRGEVPVNAPQMFPPETFKIKAGLHSVSFMVMR